MSTPQNTYRDEIGLNALLGSRGAESFLAGRWQESPVVVHGLGDSLSQLSQLKDLPFLESLDALLSFWKGKVQVHLPDVSDESHAIDADPADAKKLFTNKMALLFNNVQKFSPVLQEWLITIARELGLPASTHARCMVYATPDGKGTAPHFDQNINFVVQLHGTKKWWLAPNTSVENPTQRHTIGQETDPELASYAYEEMPTQMPAEREEFVLDSGSVLFVPRGYWHSTEATGEALALNFTYSQPTWVDLFTMALRSRLHLSPEWRELASGVSSSDPKVRKASAQRFDSLLMELADDIPNWRAEDILGATEGDFSLA